MPVSLPAYYDWSSTKAPSGPFGVEPIPGSETVLSNLSGQGAFGEGGAVNPFGSFGQTANNLSNVFRLAGDLGSLFSPVYDTQQSIKDLKNMRKQETKRFNRTVADIYPELTGLTGEEALGQYYKEFADTASKISQAGRYDLNVDPDISKQYNQLQTRVQDIQNQYSLSGRLGGYDRLALDPPVVTMDVGSLRGSTQWGSPEIAAQYNSLIDYSGPQTSSFIYGSNRPRETYKIPDRYAALEDPRMAALVYGGDKTADAIGRYYNTSGDVAGLMNYGSVS
jgi:hypothetical protein